MTAYRPALSSLLTLFSLLGTLCLPATNALAQSFPNKSIRLVVPFPPGGPTDIFARQYANGLSKVLGQNVVVDNKAGASGAIGSVEVKRATADGHTLLFGTASNLALYNLMTSTPQYDYAKDFITVAVVGGSAVVLMANKSAPQTLRALIDQAKAQPNVLRYGSPGLGTYLHLSMERLQYETGSKLEHIPYKGSGQAKPALRSRPWSMPWARRCRCISPDRRASWRLPRHVARHWHRMCPPSMKHSAPRALKRCCGMAWRHRPARRAQ